MGETVGVRRDMDQRLSPSPSPDCSNQREARRQKKRLTRGTRAVESSSGVRLLRVEDPLPLAFGFAAELSLLVLGCASLSAADLLSFECVVDERFDSAGGALSVAEVSPPGRGPNSVIGASVEAVEALISV